MGRSAASAARPAASPRSKRQAILEAAVEAFGENGYETTKWSDVAERVGIGQTALYHYFVSKAHCVFTIMRLQLTDDLERLREIVEREEDPAKALAAAIDRSLRVDDHEVMRFRILVANISLLATPRALLEEEQERRAARRSIQDVEQAWADLLARGMDDGVFPRRNSRQLAVAVLGLITSVWRWYRPGVGLSTEEMAAFYRDCALRMVAS